MPRVNRTEICADDEVQVFHLVNRCVRRTFLCGTDSETGRDFSHRKQWIRERLEELASIFAVEVLGFAVMSNHLHCVVRTRPDLVKDWSDDEVSLRWWNLFPARRNEDHSPAEPSEFELNHIRNNAAGLAEKRRRLASISWFMKCLAEPIAKRGNKEEQVTGHFWEGRFKAQPLCDEMAIAACMVYVDLNPIRAKLAQTPETSDFTSVKERIEDARHSDSIVSGSAGTSTESSVEKPTGELESVDKKDAAPKSIRPASRAGWLQPIALEVSEKQTGMQAVAGIQAAARRPSNKGCLPMTLEQYLTLVDWTGRQLRTDKRGRIPPGLAPILERLECSGESWVDLIRNFRKRFRREAGLAASVASFQERRQSRRRNSATV